ncbi:MAG: OmpH family outer membrane protein, partial [Sphingobacteriia bacterium]
MKNLFVVAVLALGLLAGQDVKAQATKIGYFDDALSLFPGIGKIDTLMNSYRMDSLQEEYKFRVAEFQRGDSLFRKDSAGMSVKAREIATRDLMQKRYQLVNWQQYQEQMEQAKYEQLVNPYRLKVAEALAEIVAEQKYTIVLKSEAISPYVQPNLLDNLTIRVAYKLKLPIPKE